MKITTLLFTIVIVYLLFIASSCERNEPISPQSQTGTLELKFNAVQPGIDSYEEVSLEDTFITVGNRKMVLDMLKYYISDVQAVKIDGSIVPIKDVALIDFGKVSHKKAHGGGVTLEIKVPIGTYKGIRYRFGLDSLTNHSDPTKLEASHPLSVNQGTVWTWASGYRFLMMEGKVDASEGANQDAKSDLSFHIGTDELKFKADFTTLSSHNFEIKANQFTHVNNNLRIDKLLGGAEVINLRTDRITHSNVNDIGLARKLVQNLKSAFEVTVDKD